MRLASTRARRLIQELLVMIGKFPPAARGAIRTKLL